MITILVFFACGGLVAIDRWLKWLAHTGHVYNLGTTQFVLVKNDALVFSWPAPNWLASMLMLIAIGVVVYLLRRCIQRQEYRRSMALVMILIGALSNLYDRLLYGFVIDWGYLGPWWPVFNLADVIIAVGIVWLLWDSRRVDKSAGRM